MGAFAVDLLCEGKSNRVVAYKDGKYVDFDMEEALAMKKDLPEYQLNLIDCINDPGCVRVMLNSSVEWNAVIIEYDFDDADVERNADLLSGWAYWAEYAKIPCLIVYIKMPSLEQDDDLELLLDYMK